MIMSFTTTLDLGSIGEQEVTVEFDYTRGIQGSFNEPARSQAAIEGFANYAITKVREIKQ